MTEILDFWLVVWTVRLLIVTFGVGSSFIAWLYLARFFRPKHIHALLVAELPTFKHVAAEVKVLGQELKASGELVLHVAGEEAALLQRLNVLESHVQKLMDALESVFEIKVAEEETHDGKDEAREGTAG